MFGALGADGNALQVPVPSVAKTAGEDEDEDPHPRPSRLARIATRQSGAHLKPKLIIFAMVLTLAEGLAGSNWW
jgi:hypothetical protein